MAGTQRENRSWAGTTGWGLVTLLAMAAITTPIAVADTASDTSEVKVDSGQLEAITVTARYTREDLQTTPLAITAVTGADLQARAVTDTANLGAIVPNLYTRPGDAEEGPTPTISMRGVTAGDYSFESYPAVGIYVDDVYHSTMVGSILDLSDVERVEVKRGPQGTLAGNASIAGSISIFSKLPKGDDTGYLSVGYGSRNEVLVKGAFDTTLAPDLYMRVSGLSKRQDGYVDQLDFTCEMNALGTPQLAGTFPTADNSAYQRGCKTGSFGGTNLSAGKVMLRWLPNDKLDVLATVSYSNEADEAPAEVLINTNPSTTDGFDSVLSAELFAKYGVVYDNRFLPPPGRPYSSYATFCRPLSGICFNNSQGQNSTDANIRADYEVADKIHLKLIGAYSDYGGYLHQAGDLSPLGYVQGQVFFNIKQWTAEARLNGTSLGDKLDWVVGFFDLSAKDHLNGAIDFVIENFTEMDQFQNDSRSGFFHGEYHLTDKWSVAAGARYSSASSTANIDHPGLITGVIPFTVSKSTPDWLLSSSFKITDDVLGYVTAASGSRPPGVTTIVNSIYQLQAIPQEKLVSYEIGMKSEFFDHRFRANLAAFYSDYSKHLATQIQFQCLAQAPPPTPVPLQSDCPTGGALQWYTTVAKPATISGFEWELTAEPVQHLTFTYDGGYNHFIDGVKVPGQPGYIVPGNLPQPEWNMNGGIQYDAKTPIGSVTPRIDWTYLSKQTFNPASSVTAPTAEYTLPARSVYNAQLTYQPENSRWTATLSAKNLFNKYYFYNQFTGSTVALAGVVAPPREWLLTLTRDFR